MALYCLVAVQLSNGVLKDDTQVLSVVLYSLCVWNDSFKSKHSLLLSLHITNTSWFVYYLCNKYLYSFIVYPSQMHAELEHIITVPLQAKLEENLTSTHLTWWRTSAIEKLSSSLYLSLFLCVVTSSFILIVSCPVCLVFCFASSFPLVCISSSCVPTCYLSSHYPVWI